MKHMTVAFAALTIGLAACSGSDNEPAAMAPRGDVAPLAVDSAALLGNDLAMYNLARRVPGFAGMYRDRDHVPHIRLIDPSQQGAAAAAVSTMLQTAGDSHANIQPVFESADFSTMDLLAWRVMARSLLKDPDVSGVAMDIIANRVVIGVAAENSNDRIQSAAAALGIPANAIRTIPLGHPIAATALTDRVRPTTGGLKTTYHGQDNTGAFHDYQCSLGANILKGSVPGLLTVSHCSLHFAQMNSTPISQPTIVGFPSNQIATESFDPPMIAPGGTVACTVAIGPCRYGDAMFATGTSGVTRGLDVAVTTVVGVGSGNAGSTTISYRDPFVGFADAHAGDYLYKTGSVTGTTYGALYTPCMDSPITYNQYPPVTVTILCAGIVAARADEGDSGAPVWVEAVNNDATLYGIVFARDTSFFWFSNISLIRQEIVGLKL